VNPWGDDTTTRPVTGRNYVGHAGRAAPRIHRCGRPGSPPFRCDHSAVVNVRPVDRLAIRSPKPLCGNKKPPDVGRLSSSGLRSDQISTSRSVVPSREFSRCIWRGARQLSTKR
jgi:hypothetical protein